MHTCILTYIHTYTPTNIYIYIYVCIYIYVYIYTCKYASVECHIAHNYISWGGKRSWQWWQSYLQWTGNFVGIDVHSKKILEKMRCICIICEYIMNIYIYTYLRGIKYKTIRGWTKGGPARNKVWTHLSLSLSLYIYIYISLSLCTNVYIYICIYIYIFTYVYIYTYIHIYIYIYIDMYVCMFIYIYILLYCNYEAWPRSFLVGV